MASACFGADSQNPAGSLEDELIAIRHNENSVRALSGIEPRYTYAQVDIDGNAIRTVSVKNSANEKKGGWKHCMNDITKLTPADDKAKLMFTLSPYALLAGNQRTHPPITVKEPLC